MRCTWLQRKNQLTLKNKAYRRRLGQNNKGDGDVLINGRQGGVRRRGPQMEGRQVAVSTTERRSVDESGGEQSDGALRDEIIRGGTACWRAAFQPP